MLYGSCPCRFIMFSIFVFPLNPNQCTCFWFNHSYHLFPGVWAATGSAQVSEVHNFQAVGSSFLERRVRLIKLENNFDLEHSRSSTFVQSLARMERNNVSIACPKEDFQTLPGGNYCAWAPARACRVAILTALGLIRWIGKIYGF